MKKAEEAGPRTEADRRLARAAAGGDAAAQRRVAERLLDRVRATVTYLAPNHRDADDLVQRSIVEVLRSTGAYRGESSLETWSDRITTRTVMRHLKVGRRQAEVVTLVSDPEPPEWMPQEDEELKLRLRRRLTSLLGRLPTERRTVVVLRFVHGYSIAEIAELTEAPVNTVRDRLRVGMAALRKYLAQEPASGEDDA